MRPLKIKKQITDRSERSIDQYFVELSKISLISAAEEAELARRIRKGDQDALHELTRSNLRFVVSVAKQYQNQGLSLSDLISEGNIGLMHAANKFDETRGFKFISYAVWWIRQSITAALTSKGRRVRLPQNKFQALLKIKKCAAILEQRLERRPTSHEIADELGMSVWDVDSILRSGQGESSIDEPLWYEDKSSTCMIDVLANAEAPQPDALLLEESLSDDISRCLDGLSENEAFVINLSFGLNGVEPMSDTELGEFLELTSERIRQIRRDAIARLKTSVRKEVLLKYLS